MLLTRAVKIAVPFVWHVLSSENIWLSFFILLMLFWKCHFITGPYIWQTWVQTTEKAMAPHSSTLAWKIPWTEEPGRLQSMRSLRVGHDWATSLSLFIFMHWRGKWQPTPAFLPGESQGQRSLVGLLSMGSHRVRHDWSNLAAAAAEFKQNCDQYELSPVMEAYFVLLNCLHVVS